MLLYNTLSRKKEQFKPIKDKQVGLYTCGPTVYNYAHLGNLRTYIFEDVLERTLEWNGYRVKRVMNITDVGHLTSDEDEGEDKIEGEARKEKKSVWEIAKFYTRAFLNDIKELNVKKPQHIAPATKFIPQQIALIKKLWGRGLAYETPQAVYFNVSRFKNYTKLSRQKLTEKKTAARKEVFEDPEKKHPHDFALWFKLAGRFKNHVMRWRSPWGIGFPGWHVECSAISTALLGQPFDIHTGGIDHIQVHHTNEIAQSEGACGKPLAKYWLHGEFLVIEEKRMGKSVGNFIKLDDLKKRNAPPLAYRYLVLGTHYRKGLNFSWEALKSSENALAKLYQGIEFLASLTKRDVNKNKKEDFRRRQYLRRFTEALNNDLNTPEALSVLWEALKNPTLPAKTKLDLILQFDEVLGLNLKTAARKREIPSKIQKLVEKRELFRTNKQFVQADVLRKKLKQVGYEIEDTAFGSRILKND